MLLIEEVTLKNNAPFRSCISKINKLFVEKAEVLKIVIPMYNLLEYCNNYSLTSGGLKYCNNYSLTSGSLWNYYRDEANHSVYENNDANN